MECKVFVHLYNSIFDALAFVFVDSFVIVLVVVVVVVFVTLITVVGPVFSQTFQRVGLEHTPIKSMLLAIIATNKFLGDPLSSSHDMEPGLQSLSRFLVHLRIIKKLIIGTRWQEIDFSRNISKFWNKRSILVS